MKKTIGIMGGIVLSLVSAFGYAQDTTKPQTPTKPQTTTWDPAKNPTVDSITAPYKGKLLPARPPLTSVDIFPVIGKYTSVASGDPTSVTITLDDQNKGLVWIDGLPQGKIKAMLRKSPATYKIPAQKTADGKDVAEGTLIFDKATGALNICIGKPFNVQDPSTAFIVVPDVNTTQDATTTTPEVTPGKTVKTKTKSPGQATVKTKTKTPGQPTVKTKTKMPDQPKPWMFTGTKVDATVMN